MPHDLQGVFLRNGPNPNFLPPNQGYHWFDGDSMIHCVRFFGRKLIYSNFQTKTPKFLRELKYCRTMLPRIGEFFKPFGVVKGILLRGKDFFGREDPIHYLRNSVANTSIVTHLDLIFATIETNLPFRIGVRHSENGGAIVDSLGHYDYDG